MKILAFESSCDETAAAVVEDGRRVLSDAIASQADLHALYGGVVPEIASRKHVEAIAALTEKALADAGCTRADIDAVAVTYAPGLIGAVLVGLSFAKSVAYGLGVPLIPRIMTEHAHSVTGIDINPGATIGKYFFIDHGTGIVIGETAEIGNNVTLYQGVTLGGTGKEKGKRHPTIGNNVVVASGAKVLGSFTVGDHAKIGAGSVVLKPVPPYATVVGIPGRIVVMGGKRVHTAEELRQALRATRLVESDDSLTDIEDELDVDLDHDMLPDPDEEMRECMMRQIQALEKKVNELEKRLEDKEHA